MDADGDQKGTFPYIPSAFISVVCFDNAIVLTIGLGTQRPGPGLE